MRPFDVAQVRCEQRTLVEASAGTGKTYAISTLAVRLLLERELTLDQLLIVTFTEAATAELKLRVRARLQDALSYCEDPKTSRADENLRAIVDARGDAAACRRRLREALSAFDDVAVLTIHGFCHRVLRENTFETGAPFTAELLKDTRPLSREVALDFWATQVSHASRNFVASLLASGGKPGELARFSEYVAHKPNLALAPDLRESPEPEDSALQRAFEQARAAFDPSVEGLLRDSGLHKRNYPPAEIHGWCGELKEYFLAEKVAAVPPPKLAKFSTASLRKAETKQTLKRPEHGFFDRVDELLAAYAEYAGDMALAVVAFKRRLADYVREEIPRRKREAEVVSFDDLLLQVHAALCGPGGRYLANSLRRRFPVALIDEFQDTDPIQYEIFDRIYAESGTSSAGNAALFMIGDPKQAIYSFRGADIFAYLRAAHSVSDARRLTMTTNYRSSPELVGAVNRLFLACPHPFHFPEIQYPEVAASPHAKNTLELPAGEDTAPLVFRFLRKADKRSNEPGFELDAHFSTDTLPRFVAGEVARLLEGGARLDSRAVTPKDFAVLTRTNAEAFNCQRALAALRIPAVVLGDRSVYEYREAEELELLLSAIIEPSNSRALRTALLTDLIGFDAPQLLALDDDEEQWDRWVERFRLWNQRWLGDGFVQMIRQVIGTCQVAERLLRLSDGERRMTNLLHLIELLHTEARVSHLGPSGLIQYLAAQREDHADIADSEQIRLESDADAVVLTTIHKSKGLEYPIVICPSLHNGMLIHPADKHLIRFHDEEHARRLTLDLGSDALDEHQRRMEEESLAENLRLTYVALTRAKQRCIVYWGRFRGFERSALGYLLHAGDVSGRAEAPADMTPPSVDAVAEHTKKLKNDDLLAALQNLDPTEARISVSECEPEQLQQAPYTKPADQEEELSCRHVNDAKRRPGRWQRTASFSSLTSGAYADPLEGRDHDASEALVTPKPPKTDRVTLADFPGGTSAGNFFHALLENADFAAEEHTELIATTLLQHGYPSQLEPIVAQSLRDVLETEIDTQLRLNQLSTTDRLNELEFTLVAQSENITPRALAHCFEEFQSAELEPIYAARVAQLAFATLSGFLKGFIDLVFRHDGRWYVVDYKTNNLGQDYTDYDAPALATAMSEHHYYLQYHLYAVALHRYLTLRLPDYDYERHFGGVKYLFLRGMHPRHGIRYGTFSEKPPRARIEALSALFGAAPTRKDSPA